jgi:hypothetical protein
MNKKVMTAALVVFLLIAIFPGASLAQQEASGSYFAELEGYVDLYNSNLASIPGIVKRLFSNERINFHIALSEGEEIIGVSTSETCEILEFVDGALETPTLRVYIEGEIIDDLMANPSQEKALAAINSIKIEGVGFFNKLKVAFVNLIRTVSNWFM